MSGEETRGCFVRINLPEFIQNAAERGLRLSPDQAIAVLTDWGFTLWRADLWYCDKPALDSLKPGEIVEILASPPPAFLDRRVL